MKEYNNGFSSERGLFKLAGESSIHRNFIWFSILAFLVMIVGSIPSGIGSIIAMEMGVSPFVQMLMELTFGFAGISILVYLIVRYREKRSFRDIGFEKKGMGAYIKGFGLGGLLMIICTSIMTLLGGMQLVFREPGTGIQALPFVLIILLGWIVQGGTEEILTRGWMLPLLGKRYNVPFAIGVSSIFFMFLHSGNNGMTLMPILNLVLFGVFAALYVVNEESIWGICGMHSAWNWMQGNVLGIAVSGTEPAGGSLLKFVPKGHELISGGAFGVEGSIVCSIVFLLASTYLVKKILDK